MPLLRDGVKNNGLQKLSYTSKAANTQLLMTLEAFTRKTLGPILLWLVEDDLLEYAHKQKFLDWLGKQQSHSAEVTSLIKDATKVINKM
jgi:hypothetical protein